MLCSLFSDDILLTPHDAIQVQLSTTHTVSIELPSTITTANASSSASKILALIESEEGRYQTSLNEAYQEMGDKTFKGLRRALPMTRAKLDWDRVRYSPFETRTLLIFTRIRYSDTS